MTKRALAKSLGRGRAVLCQNILLQRARIYADSNGNSTQSARVRYRLDVLVLANVAGVDSYLVYAKLCTTKRDLIVKMNIGNDGYVYSVFFENAGTKVNGYKMSVFGSQIPYLTLNFKF